MPACRVKTQSSSSKKEGPCMGSAGLEGVAAGSHTPRLFVISRDSVTRNMRS